MNSETMDGLLSFLFIIIQKLRVHQHRCESIETVVHPYTSCQYAWDEPFYPHRLIVEVL
jgi:hypothetical protein